MTNPLSKARALVAAASRGPLQAQRDEQGRMKLVRWEEGNTRDGLEGWCDLAEFFIDPEKRNADEANAKLATLQDATWLEILEALAGIADAVEPHAALQDKATDPRVGLTQPITVAEGTALVEALQQVRAALEHVAKELDA